MHVTVTPCLHPHSQTLAQRHWITVHACVRIQAMNLFTCVCSQMHVDGLHKPAPEAHPDQEGRGGESGVGESENTHSHSHSAATVSESHHHDDAACDRPTKVGNGCLLSIRNSSEGKAAHTRHTLYDGVAILLRFLPPNGRQILHTI